MMPETEIFLGWFTHWTGSLKRDKNLLLLAPALEDLDNYQLLSKQLMQRTALVLPLWSLQATTTPTRASIHQGSLPTPLQLEQRTSRCCPIHQLINERGTAIGDPALTSTLQAAVLYLPATALTRVHPHRAALRWLAHMFQVQPRCFSRRIVT